MGEVEWLASDDPGRMLLWITCAGPSGSGEGDLERWRSRPSDRKLRLFVLACAEADPDRTPWVVRSWQDWSEREETGPGEFSPADAALYWCGRKVGQHEPIRLTPEGRAAKASVLREIVGNPFRPVTLPHVLVCLGCGRTNPRTKCEYTICVECDGDVAERCPWLTPTVLGIARRCYDDRDFDGLPVLADALEEAGCDCEPLLRHLRGYEVCLDCMLPSPGEAEYGGGIYWCPGCGGTKAGNPDAYWMRSPGPHVRGCWALDLVLGIDET